jgi:hypothetical protein
MRRLIDGSSGKAAPRKGSRPRSAHGTATKQVDDSQQQNRADQRHDDRLQIEPTAGDRHAADERRNDETGEQRLPPARRQRPFRSARDIDAAELETLVAALVVDLQQRS